MGDSVTLEIKGKTTPERLLETIRAQAPHLLREPPPGVPAEDRLLLTGEVAALFRVDPKTVAKWAKQGKLTSIRTLGGHRRYRESEVRALIDGSDTGLGG